MRQLKDQLARLIPRGTTDRESRLLMQSAPYRRLARELERIAVKYGFRDQIERKGRKVSTRKAVARIAQTKRRAAKRGERQAVRLQTEREAPE
jgi:hypothetical protein